MSYDKAANLLRLAICAAGRVGMTLGEIEEMFECDRRTAQRMTVKLSQCLERALRVAKPWACASVDDGPRSAWSEWELRAPLPQR